MIPSWITVNQVSGASGETTVTFTASANDTQSARTATLTVTGRNSGLQKTVTITQNATRFAWVFPTSGQRNVSSGVTSAWWLVEAVGVGNIGIGTKSPMFNSYTIEEYQSTTYPRATHIIRMYFSENTGDARNGMFTVTASTTSGYLTGNLSQEKGQGEAASISLTPSATTVNAASGSTTYTITMTGTVTGLTATTNGSWISQPITISGDNLIVYYQDNPSATERTATITLSGNGGGVTATATLTQGIPTPKITILSPTAKTVDANTTSVAWTYSVVGNVTNINPVYTADWITNVTLSYPYMTVTFNKNATDNQRSTIIRITGSTGTGTVSSSCVLEQNGSSLTLDPNELIFGYNAGESKAINVYTNNNWRVIDITDE